MAGETSSHHELIKDGGRPACSIQELSHILAEPRVRYKAILSWLSGDPDSEIGAGEMKTVFSRQFTRWWDFRKSQWVNRGIGDGEEEFSAFFEASRRRYEGMGGQAMVSAPSFEETGGNGSQHPNNYLMIKHFPPTERLSRDVSPPTTLLNLCS